MNGSTRHGDVLPRRGPGLPLLGRAPEPTAATPAFAAKGFRPFFLGAGAFAALILPVWLLTLAGVLGPTRYLDAVTWHAHEMLFGFTVAVIAGFLLTAVGNWTGRETLVGTPLLAVGALWVLGRVAMAFAGALPRGVAAAVDLAFLPALVVAIARPLVATRNRRNFVMVAVVTVLWVANLLLHLDTLGVIHDWNHRAVTLALDVIVLLLIVITGRVVPMFTKNATGVASVRSLPTLDKAAMAAMVATTLLDLVAPSDMRLGGSAAIVAAVLVVLRSSTWGTFRTARVPLTWILHAGHAWIAVGLALRGAAAFTGSVPAVVATHALTVGAIGTLTLAMMSRVTLGHTGRKLEASRVAVASFVLVTLAALVRVFGPLADMAAYRTWVFAAGLLWTAAFGCFVVAHAPLLVSRRADGKPG
jgi:uncharacterized protein involved in response to NO